PAMPVKIPDFFPCDKGDLGDPKGNPGSLGGFSYQWFQEQKTLFHLMNLLPGRGGPNVIYPLGDLLVSSYGAKPHTSGSARKYRHQGGRGGKGIGLKIDS